MKKVLSGIILSACVPSQAIKNFIEFEKAQANVRKLNEGKMTDKIKVWKCDGCSNSGRTAFCIFTDFSNNTNSVKNCPHGLYDNPPWQPTTDYEITERKPEPVPVITTQEQLDEKYGKGKFRVTQDAPPVEVWPIHKPRRRVKIIWSEVTAENVDVAARLKLFDGEIAKRVNNDDFFGGVRVSDIPESWLEDIDDGPEQAIVWIDKQVTKHGTCDHCQRLNMKAFDIFTAGETNERKQYLPTMSFDEWKSTQPWYYSDPDENNSIQRARLEGWNARGISNNLPPEPK